MYGTTAGTILEVNYLYENFSQYGKMNIQIP